MVTQSPERNWSRIYASHPDHMAAGEAAICAVYPDARNPFAFPELLEEGLEPHTVPEMWIMATDRADRVVDTTDVLRPQAGRPAARTGARSVTATTSTTCCAPGCRAPRWPPDCPTEALAEAFHVVATG